MKYLGSHISLVILFCTGFFLIPNISGACAKKSVKAVYISCPDKPSKTKDHLSCCKSGTCEKGMSTHNCSEECEHSSCGCTTSTSSLTFHAPVNSDMETHFAEIEQPIFGFKKASYSSGYLSIWLPPKIR